MGYKLHVPLVCVVGPTATGKTELAQLVAENIGACVLSADSMQVYTGMDIGTGKIEVAERRVEHFGIDLVDPGQPYSASLFQDYGRTLVESFDKAGKRLVVCGGTGFYIRALVDDFEFPPGDQLDNPIRAEYRTMLRNEGVQAVWNALNDVDPASAAVIPPNDSKRVIRALELHAEGLSYLTQKERFSSIPPYYPTCQIGLCCDVDVLASRIDARVDRMIETGLVGEVRSLIERGYVDAVTANQAIGYKEIVDYINGECTLDVAIDRIKTATRRYAKRQRTWFRKDPRIHWLDVSAMPTDDILAQALDLVEEADVSA